MDFSCSDCNTITKLDVKFEVSYFACPHCGKYYGKNNKNEFIFKERFKKVIYNNLFSVGQKAIFSNVEYTIVGLLVKNYNGNFSWAEYILQNSDGGFKYLSESEGNYILLEEIEFKSKVGNHPLVVEYQKMSFDRYDYSYPKLHYASGFFDFNVLNKTELVEYINPPYILSFERFEQEQVAFYGKHISRRAIKKAFNTSQIPSKSEMGMVQPFLFNIKNLIMTFCSIGILILISHYIINKDRTEKEVLNTSVAFDKYASKDFVSESFVLSGSSAPLQINVASNVNNSWANIQVALVNEKTNEEIYASKDIEYYHGYTEGESWTEGSTSEDFNICGVPEGKYHITLTPAKAPEDPNNSEIYVIASWNKPSMRNVYMTFIFMVAFVIIVYYLSKYYEDKRWNEQ